MAFLFIVATPIGNLKDISARALETLKSVDLILAEDTRTTRKLLSYYQIKTPILAYHQHSKVIKVNFILNLLKENKKLALVSEAGTPGVSDPGNLLVNEAIKRLSDEVRIIPIPGPSAVTAAVSVSGLAMDKFLFLGFPPSKKKRKKFFEQVLKSQHPVIFYESPHRILKTLSELQSLVISHKSLVNIVVCRELTKKFETIYRGTIEEVIEEIQQDKIKGEFVVVVGGRK